MTLASFLDELAIAGVYLFIAYFVREKTPLRKLYLPAAVIAGAIILVLGPQVTGLINTPESFYSYSSALAPLAFTTMVWGITLNLERIKNYLDYTIMEFSITWWQICIGGIIAMICLTIWTGMPKGWGMCAPFGFLSGHGTSTIYQTSVYDAYGVEGVGDLGLVTATVGLVAAMLLGSVFVNIGIRKGYAKFMTPDKQIRVTKGGALAPEDQSSIGTEKVENPAINNLLFQLVIVLVIQFIGVHMVTFICKYIPALASLKNMGGVLGAIILWPVFRKAGLDKYVDRQTVSLWGGFLIDLLVTGAIATLNLSLVTQYWIPLTIMSVVIVLFVVCYTFFFSYKCFGDEWFEKAIFVYGFSTGVIATGFALHRMLDPDKTSIVPEVQGVASCIMSPITFPAYTVFSILAITRPVVCIGVSGAMGIAFTIALWMIGRRRTKLKYGR